MSSPSLFDSRNRWFLGVLLAVVVLPACGSSKKGSSTPSFDSGAVDMVAADGRSTDVATTDVAPADGVAAEVTATDARVGEVGADGARGDAEVGGSAGDSGTARDVPADTSDGAAAPDVPSDRAVLPDAPPAQDKPDVAPPSIDATPDQPIDHAGVEAATDLAAETSADAITTLNVFGNCKQYTHTRVDSQGKPYTFGIRGVAFTPDGKYLISFGADSRAKAWKVTASGLADAVTGGLIFTGDRNLTGVISADGKRVAIGDQSGRLTVYDFESSVQLGAAVILAEFPPPSAFANITDGVKLLQYTSDGKHLVAFYRAFMGPDLNHLLVWDIDTRAVLRDVTFAYDDVVEAVLPGAYTEPMWVVSSKENTLASGDYEYVVSLVDVATSEPRAVAQLVTPDEAVAAAFWPDASTLVLGLDDGEVGLWDITDKANIARLGSPLVAASADDTVFSLAFTSDKKSLAAGRGAFFRGIGSVWLSSADRKTTLEKTLDYYPWSLGFAPDGLALAVGGDTDGALIYCTP